ncbi:two-component response regulator-like APRR5 [Vigna umbellata]|uniref:two-component response regulator-like APRR5 n=1 Tax=Vigna umbellata TaxID=87088 RepID=UPI001F5EC196|nr:two-component response regulator-like APRR5 [Vigna umbellata]
MGEVAGEKGVMQTQEEQSNNGSMVRWERFLPRMVLRVLLVEADDSTRQIIAALLRKCSYKTKHLTLDLILTEWICTSISGFSLLSLIMEHDVCKNIPVIMMSSHDSVSMVFRCMLKGAADFLIKPVRKNELRNLWQHVWRRHVDISQLKEFFKFETDMAQLSMTTLQNVKGIRYQHNDKAGGQGYDFGEMRNQDEVLRIELSKANPAISVDIRGSSDELEGPSTGAIDLIGTFKTLPERYFPGGSYKAVFEERQILNHSNASAFSRYGSSKLLQPLCPTPSTISAKLTNDTGLILLLVRLADTRPLHDINNNNLCVCYNKHRLLQVMEILSILSQGSQGQRTESSLILGHLSHDGYIGFRFSSLPANERAASNKFRLKRKDICYEKKVRYQSRKRLAEQRPRVKGQFVRQVDSSHPVSDLGGDS